MCTSAYFTFQKAPLDVILEWAHSILIDCTVFQRFWRHCTGAFLTLRTQLYRSLVYRSWRDNGLIKRCIKILFTLFHWTRAISLVIAFRVLLVLCWSTSSLRRANSVPVLPCQLFKWNSSTKTEKVKLKIKYVSSSANAAHFSVIHFFAHV